MSTSANLYGVAVGTVSTSALGLTPIGSKVAPSSSNVVGPSGQFNVGQQWIDTANNTVYILTSLSSSNSVLSATWSAVGSSTGILTSLAGDSGTATPSSGVITISGGSTGLTTSASSHTVDLTGTLAVASGGTGVATLTGVLTGNGTSAVTANAVTNHGVLVAGASNAVASLTVGTNGQVLLGSTGANPAFGTLTTSTGVSFTTGAASLAINVKSGGYAVTSVAGASQALVSQGTYVANDSAQTTFTLPATSAVGDIINVVGSSLNTGGWVVTYGSNQIIWGPAGHSTLTSGNATSAAAAAQTMTIMCTVANTIWVIIANSGTITLN